MRKPSKWNLEKAIQLKEKGYSYSDIAISMGVKPITIQSYFLRNFGKLDYNTNTAKKIELTQRQKEVMFGGLLGDSNLHINPKSINPWGKIEHSLQQEDYLKYKREIFKNIANTVRYSHRFDKRTNKIYHSCRFNFYANPALKEFYDSFYNGRNKDVPIDLSLLTPEAIAIWFMDDGSKSGKTYILCTHSFSKKGCNRLMSKLLDYNIETTLQKSNAIYIRYKSQKHFKNLIEPYIIDSMKYKL